MNVYEEFRVEGVKPDDIWQLFNVSNYPYYCLKVQQLRDGICGFCTIDPDVNKILPIANDSWYVMENTVAARSDKTGQEHQFVIPCKKHISSIDEMTRMQGADLVDLCQLLNLHFSIDGGVLLTRSGNPRKNAKSMPHLHFNYHVPTGHKRVEVTIAKSDDDLEKKLGILHVFETMRQQQESGCNDPFSLLPPSLQDLVKDKLGNVK